MTGVTFVDDEAILNALRQIGARFDPETLQSTRTLYREVVRALPWADRANVPDIAYGPHDRHRLDVYSPDSVDAPVLLFVHGGGFVGGDKRSDADFYGNVGRYFAAHGYLTILMNYRLAPAAIWPSGMEDVSAVIKWISKHARDYGGDPHRVIFVGQSAGAAHVASYLFDPRSTFRKDGSIRAAALLSGFYRPKHPLPGGAALYVGVDETLWNDRSAASHVTAGHPPILLSVAELDPAIIADQTFELAMALNAADGHPSQLLWFQHHNHVSTVHGLGVGQDIVGRALRAFAAQHSM